MNPSTEILDRLDRATTELQSASRAAIQLARSMMAGSAARAADSDDWARLPMTGTRCPASGWSRSTLCRNIVSGNVRGKSVGSSKYYALKDVRELIANKAP